MCGGVAIFDYDNDGRMTSSHQRAKLPELKKTDASTTTACSTRRVTAR